MANSFSDNLFEILGGLVLQRLESGIFSVIASPEWVQSLKGQFSGHWDFSHFLEQCKPLQNKVEKANKFWDENENGELELGPWMETMLNGDECALEAIAYAMGKDRFLHIRKVARHVRDRLHKTAVITLKQGEQIAEHSRRRDDLAIILDHIQVGALMTDVQGSIIFANQWALQMIKKAKPEVIGKRWDRVLPLSDQEIAALRKMSDRPPARRPRVLVRMKHETEAGIALEMDIQDDPRDPKQKMYFLYDVT